MTEVDVSPHPLLDPGLFAATLPRALGELDSSERLTALLSLEADAPMQANDEVRTAVRLLLRHGGYKPSGRGKPASEYLRKADAEGLLTSINPVVDACNVVSLHSGLPISVVDLDLAQPSLSIRIADDDATYVFNPSGHEIKLTGLLALHDRSGPCANAVKDSQRTKTHDGTTRILCVVWGTNALEERTKQASAWYRTLLEETGAQTEAVATRP